MKTQFSIMRIMICLILASFLFMMSFPQYSLCCDFDQNSPSLENAARSMKGTDFDCAEQEARAFLGKEWISPGKKAAAHMLLGEIAYFKSSDNVDTKNIIINEYKEALHACFACSDSLEPSRPELQNIFRQAYLQVQSEIEAERKQLTKKPGLIIGVRAGIGKTNFATDLNEGESIWNFGGGALVRFYLNSRLAVQPEVSIIGKGSAPQVLPSEKYQLTYIDFPLLIMYRLHTNKSFDLSIFDGPGIGLLIGASVNGEDREHRFKKHDIGNILGVGIGFKEAGREKISIDLRYTLGLTNIAHDLIFYPGSGYISASNRVFMSNISYLFHI